MKHLLIVVTIFLSGYESKSQVHINRCQDEVCFTAKDATTKEIFEKVIGYHNYVACFNVPKEFLFNRWYCIMDLESIDTDLTYICQEMDIKYTISGKIVYISEKTNNAKIDHQNHKYIKTR